MTGSYKNIDKTNVSAEFGQINSAFFDTRLNIVQSLSHPKVFRTEKKALTEEWKTKVLMVGWKELELKKAVSQAFYSYLYWNRKLEILYQADTLFSNFYSKTVLRLQKGEANILEKTTAETQRAAIRLQVQQSVTQQTISLLELKLLLNTTENIEPKGSFNELTFLTDSSMLTNHPYLAALQQQLSATKAMTEVEKAKLLPNFSAGYSNISFRGIGPDNLNYKAIDRFHGFQIGMGIPIFNKAQKVRIHAAQLSETIAQHQIGMTDIELRTKYNQLIINYNNQVNWLQYYEKEGNQNAATITSTANRQFVAGEINYLDWVILVRQALTIQEEYLEALKSLNDTALSLKYLTL